MICYSQGAHVYDYRIITLSGITRPLTEAARLSKTLSEPIKRRGSKRSRRYTASQASLSMQLVHAALQFLFHPCTKQGAEGGRWQLLDRIQARRSTHAHPLQFVKEGKKRAELSLALNILVSGQRIAVIQTNSHSQTFLWKHLPACP